MATAMGGLLACALIPVFWAQQCDGAGRVHRRATDLIAGRTTPVGNVNVCNDGTTLTVTYEVTSPWCLPPEN